MAIQFVSRKAGMAAENERIPEIGPDTAWRGR
jgi:hypothetical protein